LPVKAMASNSRGDRGSPCWTFTIFSSGNSVWNRSGQMCSLVSLPR
jgi:hypothetical protein